ncbi:hypothetical protein PF008_g25582 [Phytophthora fragariae]|uniref:Uncharacterized protein n=1 Tax=Phytophthora fragariae TaxID=53985 RepID=A0A6G0QJP3_9STRA|nr:hypothetical protein PF008_g25582 [Phytophthora fragariae]
MCSYLWTIYGEVTNGKVGEELVVCYVHSRCTKCRVYTIKAVTLALGAVHGLLGREIGSVFRSRRRCLRPTSSCCGLSLARSLACLAAIDMFVFIFILEASFALRSR